jgi:molybdopterin-guanine dinucleotide biosynthesis protein A
MNAAGMIMIGATSRNADETELACSLIRRFAPQASVAAVKVTAIREHAKGCPRGSEGHGVCSSLTGDFEITEETGGGEDKDTARLLRAGATRVFWLRCLHEALEPAATALLERIGSGQVVVCVSNSLRTLVEPDLFLMVRPASAPGFEPTAADVRVFAARVIPFTDDRLEFDLDDIQLCDGRWQLRERTPMPATAVILAGGRSTRMGEDKSLLPIDGQPLIQRLYRLLSQSCDEVLISANDPDRFAFLQAPVVPDREPGQGPLMAIASALDRAKHELCFVAACDLPGVDGARVRRLLREATGFDAVVPMTADGHMEPLHAVYRKTFLPAAEAVLAAGRRRVKDGIDRVHVNFVNDVAESELRNLNTRLEYEAYVRAKARDH